MQHRRCFSKLEIKFENCEEDLRFDKKLSHFVMLIKLMARKTQKNRKKKVDQRYDLTYAICVRTTDKYCEYEIGPSVGGIIGSMRVEATGTGK